MREDLKPILDRLNSLSKKIDKNTKIVKDLRSHNRWAFFFKIVYWAFLIMLAYGSWYIMQPVIESLRSTVDMISKTGSDISSSLDAVKGATQSLDNLKNLGSDQAQGLGNLLDSFKK